MGDDVSWYEYPIDIKNLTKDSALAQPKYLANIDRKSCLGERSCVDVFLEHNSHLPKINFDGIYSHLIQDYVFDEWIRENINCSNMYEPNAVFVMEGRKYGSEQVREVIKLLEELGFYILANLCYEKYGIVSNQEWFDIHVKKILDSEYPLDMAESTYKYMKIPKYIDEWITNKDWSHYGEATKYLDSYYKLYDDIVYNTKNTDDFININFGEKREK